MIDGRDNEPAVHFSCANENVDFNVDENNQPSTSQGIQVASSIAKGKQGPSSITKGKKKATNLMDDTELYAVDTSSAAYNSASKQSSATNLMDETTL